MTTGADFIKELLANADPEKLAAFVKEIKPTHTHTHRPATQQAGPVKQYTTVIKQYTCITCGYKFDTIYKMEKGECVSVINEHGGVEEFRITNQASLTLNSFCSICTHCKVAASEWTREELERRWLALVAACSFKEKKVALEKIARPMEEFRL